MTPITEIAFVLDRSGSMQPIADDAIGGFNAFVAEQRAVGPGRLTLVLFDHDYDVVHDGVALDQVPPLDSRSYVPRGQTALLDAIDRTLDALEARARGPVIVAILTDGHENASTRASVATVQARVRRLQRERDYRFVFLGADLGQLEVARQLGVRSEDSVIFERTGEGIRDACRTASQTITDVRISQVFRD